MKGCVWIANGDGGGTVVGGRVALTEVVSFDGGGVATDLFLGGISERMGFRRLMILTQSISSRSSDSRM